MKNLWRVLFMSLLISSLFMMACSSDSDPEPIDPTAGLVVDADYRGTYLLDPLDPSNPGKVVISENLYRKTDGFGNTYQPIQVYTYIDPTGTYEMILMRKGYTTVNAQGTIGYFSSVDEYIDGPYKDGTYYRLEE